MAVLRRFIAAQWSVGASALLHGGVLALLLWQMSAPPVAAPQGDQATMTVDLVMAETPAVIPAAPPARDQSTAPAETSVADPEPAALIEVAEPVPPTTVIEDAPVPVVEEMARTPTAEDPPPPIETTVAEIVLPPPPPPETKPEPAPEPKPQVSRRSLPPPKPAVPSSPPQAASAMPSGEDKPVIALPRPGMMLMPEQAMASPIMPPVPVGPPVDYVGLVRAQLERFKQYPRAAQQRRLQGEVMLSIVIDSGGQVLAYRLIKGSGHDILDREVAELVKRASPLPPIPARLKTDRLEIVIPIEFLLQG